MPLKVERPSPSLSELLPRLVEVRADRRPSRRRGRACGTLAHFWTNSVLPLTRLSPSSLSWQPVSATTRDRRQRAPCRTRPPLMARASYLPAGRGDPAGARRFRHGRGRSLQAALGGGDDGPRDAVPGVALARHADDRVARARAQRRPAPRARRRGPSASCVTACGPTSNVSHGRDLGRDGGGERARDLGHAGVARDDRQRAARRGLGGDHPERLGERARHRERVGGGQHVGRAPRAPAARPSATRVRHAARPRRGTRPPRDRARRGTRRARAARGRPRRAARGRRPGPRARASPASPSSALAEGAEADDEQPRVRHAGEHERPGGEQQLDALGGDQLADVDDDPVARGVERAERGGGLGGRAGERGACRAGRPASRAPRRRARARSRSSPAAAAAAARAGAKRVTSTPGGPSRVLSSQPRLVQRRPQALGRVARADEHPARGREPLARGGQEARVRLDRVLERAAVDLDRVRDAGPRERAREDQRAHHEVVRERDVGPRARDDLADGGDVALDVVVDLLLARAPGTAAPRRRRSGRRRRPAAGRRCRAGRRSRAPGRAATVSSSAPPSQSPAASTHGSSSGARSWHSRCTSWPLRTNASPSAALYTFEPVPRRR